MFPNGVVYEGLNNNEPMSFRGESGANDSMGNAPPFSHLLSSRLTSPSPPHGQFPPSPHARNPPHRDPQRLPLLPALQPQSLPPARQGTLSRPRPQELRPRLQHPRAHHSRSH